MSLRTTVLPAAAAAAVAAAVAAAALAVPTASEAAPARLLASVGPGHTIKLTTATGARVRMLKAGVYTIVVRDVSAEHNFVLRGHGVSKATSVVGTGRSTWSVRIASGRTYTFTCAPHAGSMRGSFRGV